MERGLIIKKEWLDLIFDNGKVWEMRSRPVSKKLFGRIGLIESGSGLIIGEATLVYCFKPSTLRLQTCMSNHQVEDMTLFKKWPYAWILKEAKRYEKPIPYNHPQGAVIWVKV